MKKIILNLKIIKLISWVIIPQILRLLDKRSWAFPIPNVRFLDSNTELKERESVSHLRRVCVSAVGTWVDGTTEPEKRTDFGWQGVQNRVCKVHENFKHQFN